MMNIGILAETLDLDQATLEKATKVSEQLLSDSFIMLHVTAEKSIPSILSEGLRNETNPHAHATTAIPENGEDIALYTYSMGEAKIGKVVIGIPHDMVEIKNGDNLSKADKAYLNCVFEERDDGKFYIPTMFIKGHFDNDMNFISNPAYILDQPNSLELMQQYSKEIDNRFLKRASNPKIEQQLVDDKIKNSIENELRKQGYNKDEIFLVMRSKQETSDERILTARNESVKLSEKYSNEFTNANDVLPKNKLTIDLNNIKTVGKLELSSVINMTSELMKDMLGQSLNTPSINTQIKKQ